MTWKWRAITSADEDVLREIRYKYELTDRDAKWLLTRYRSTSGAITERHHGD